MAKLTHNNYDINMPEPNVIKKKELKKILS